MALKDVINIDIYLYPKQVEASQNVLMQIVDFIAGIPEAIGLVEPQAEEPDNSSATFLNVYERKFAPLSFGKEWSDFGQSATRFTVPMQFDVYRSANAQSGQGSTIWVPRETEKPYAFADCDGTPGLHAPREAAVMREAPFLACSL